MTSSHNYFSLLLHFVWARVAQSVQCMAMDWTTGWSEFNPQKRQHIFPLACVQTGSGAHPASYPMDTRGAAQGVMLTAQPHLVPRLRMSRSYTSFPPKRHHDM
jgi:hypothetical protein